jgi:hypothetical protein
MNIRIVALLAALVPFVAVHLTWLVAASHGLVEWCNPYIHDCTSISATGRHPPASFLFRASMLPAAVLFAGYWWVNHAWMATLAGRKTATNRWMLGLGLLASLGLILYVTVLGEAGDAWARQRRIGTVLFFSFTFLCQLLLVAQLKAQSGRLPQVQGLVQGMWRLCIALLTIGLLTVILEAWNRPLYKSMDNSFEWVLTLLLQVNFFLGYLVWRRAGLTLAASDHSLTKLETE